MIRLLLRRLAVFPLALIAINFFGFAYARFARYVQAGRNPYLAVGDNPEPLLPAYQAYLQSAQDGFGFMPTARGISIVEMISDAAISSLGLLGIAFGIAVIAGFVLGFLATRSDPPGIRVWLVPFSTIGMAMPSFYIGGMLITLTVFLLLQGLTGQSFILPISGFGWDEHLVFPAIAMALRPTVQIAQITAVMLSTELRKQYVTVARAMGNTWQSIRRHHALRNILPTLILSVANAFRYSLVELVLVETLFSWTGIGRLLAQTLMPPAIATVSRSALVSPIYLYAPLVATLLTVFGIFFLLTDLLASISANLADPHLRALGEEAQHD
jgi:peptide/nickel transport system permease protein